MQKQILGYKSFTRGRILHLKESQDEKEFQMEELRATLEKDSTFLSCKMEDAVWYDKDNCIDFEGDVSFKKGKFKGESIEDEINFKFGNIYGDFSCAGSDNLKTLKGGPKGAYDFDASDCSLESLEGSPEYAHNFNVSHNHIKTLHGCPKYIFGDFNLADSLVRSLDFGPLLVTGTITLYNSSSFIKKEINGKSIIRLFLDMHRFLTMEYMSVGRSYQVETIKKIEADIASGAYVTRIIVENPDYQIFLGNFKDQLGDKGHVRSLKDLGIF